MSEANVQPERYTGAFDFDAGHLALDFGNTADWHAGPAPVERLTSYQDLIHWGLMAGELKPDAAQRLLAYGARFPAKAQTCLVRARELREAIYQLFSAVAAGERPGGEALERFNSELGEAMAHAVLAPQDQGFGWGWREDRELPEKVIWPVVRQAAELLTSPELDRVRECADDRGCGYLFIDRSRNKSRRWCSMESCGNRAKARRHYARVTVPGDPRGPLPARSTQG
jgi:predicted RNA-binding Zn ribbon-like protein